MWGTRSGQRGARSRLGYAGVTLLAAMAMPVVLSSCGGSAMPQSAKQPVIVDTDMASDDIMALCYLLEQPGSSVQAITVEGTGEAHGPAGARNALRLIKALGIQRRIPVAYGPPDPLSGFISFPVSWRATADGMYGLNLPAWRGPQPSESAVRLLTDTISRSPAAGRGGHARPVHQPCRCPARRPGSSEEDLDDLLHGRCHARGRERTN